MKYFFNNMKIKFFNLLAFVLCLLLAIISLLALFGEDSSIDILMWIRNRLGFLALFILGTLGVYYLSPFVIDLTDEE